MSAPHFRRQSFLLQVQGTLTDQDGNTYGLDGIPGDEAVWFGAQAMVEKHSWYALQDTGLGFPPGQVAYRFQTYTPPDPPTPDNTLACVLRLRRTGWLVPIRITWSEDVWDVDALSPTYNTILSSTARELTLDAGTDTTADYTVPPPSGANTEIFLSDFKVFAPWM